MCGFNILRQPIKRTEPCVDMEMMSVCNRSSLSSDICNLFLGLLILLMEHGAFGIEKLLGNRLCSD